MYLKQEPSWGPIQNKNLSIVQNKFISTGYKLILQLAVFNVPKNTFSKHTRHHFLNLPKEIPLGFY